jgi:hypothetical protein
MSPDVGRVEFSDGRRAILLRARQRLYGGLQHLVVSSPGGTYGGWLSTDPLTEEHARLLRTVLMRTKNLGWRVNPYDRLQAETCTDGFAADFTQSMYLGGDPGRAMRSAGRAHRKALNRAYRSGLTLRVASSPADWQAHFRAYRLLSRRWRGQSSYYSGRFFEILQRMDSPHVRLWVVEKDGRYLSSVVCFYWGGVVNAWHSAALERDFGYRPNNFMYHEIARNAAAEGYEYLDMNPSGGHEGVVAFKRHLGTSEVPSPVYESYTALFRGTMILRSAMSPKLLLSRFLVGGR